VAELENSDEESSGRRTVNSSVPSSKSEEDASSKDSNEITFNIMQPTLVDDDVECFETKPHSEVKHAKPCNSDVHVKEKSISPNLSSPNKTDSQSPDFKKSKILKKDVVTCLDTDSDDDVSIIIKAKDRQPHVQLFKLSPAREELPADNDDALPLDNQYLIPGPSWFQPRTRNLQRPPALKGRNQDGDVEVVDGKASPTILPDIAQEHEWTKDQSTADFVLRKSPRHRMAEDGINEGRGGLVRSQRGKNKSRRGGRGRGQNNVLREKSGVGDSDEETDIFESIKRSKENDELYGRRQLENEGIEEETLNKGPIVVDDLSGNFDRRRGRRNKGDAGQSNSGSTEERVRGRNSGIDDNSNQNNSSNSEDKDGDMREGNRQNRGRTAEQPVNRGRVMEQSYDDIGKKPGNRGRRKRVMEEDQDVELEKKTQKVFIDFNIS